MTRVRPTHFCYPCGIYRSSYFGVLGSEGVVTATTTEPGLATSSDPRFLLPRFVDMDVVRDVEFESWLSGVLPWVRDALKPAPDAAQRAQTALALAADATAPPPAVML